MSEIRSTMDLIMERTRGMTLTDREKADFRMEDLRRKAKGYCLRLLDDPERNVEILEALDKEPEEDRKELPALIWRGIVEDLPGDKGVFKYLDLLERLPLARSVAHDLKEFRGALNAALKGGAAARHKMLAREKRKLESLGISGSAVAPKLPADASAEADFPAIVAKFMDKLERARE